MPRRPRHNPSDEAERLYREQFRYAANFPRTLQFPPGTHQENMKRLQRAFEAGSFTGFFTVDEIERFIDYSLRADRSAKAALHGSPFESGDTGVEAYWMRNIGANSHIDRRPWALPPVPPLPGEPDEQRTTVFDTYSVTFHSGDYADSPDETYDTEEDAEMAGQNWVAEMRTFDEDVDDDYGFEVELVETMFIVELKYVGGRGFSARSASVESEGHEVEMALKASVLLASQEQLADPDAYATMGVESYDLRAAFDDLQAEGWEPQPVESPRDIIKLVYTRDEHPAGFGF